MRAVAKALLTDPLYQSLVAFIHRESDAYLATICRICEIPAPPFQEERRASFVANCFRQAGFDQVTIDQEGNVVALYPRTASGPGRSHLNHGTLVVSAHLDTVFPSTTDVTVRREANRLLAPGISDNSASVAGLLFLARGLLEVGFKPHHELIFLANVGEEGLGDLRGMKHFLLRGEGSKRPVRAVLVLDGPLGMVSHQGIGSRRLAVTFRGQGGHSWGDFGRPSAIHAMARVIANLDTIALPTQPRTTINVGIVEGGTSVNAIAEQARMLVDLRSEDAGVLRRLEQDVRQIIGTTCGRLLATEVVVVGDRPLGSLSRHHPLLQLTLALGQASGIPTACAASSTDANIPLSLGIPAVSLGIKRGGDAHTLNEYLEIESIIPGFQFGCAVLLGFSHWVESVSTHVRS